MSLFEKFKLGLKKSSVSIKSGIKDIFSSSKIDDETLSKFEDLLISADIGTDITSEIKNELKKTKVDKEKGHQFINNYLLKYMSNILLPCEKNLDQIKTAVPTILLVSGVNGVGKTTTIGKIANYFKGQGHKVLVGAADTFRAAAIEQLSEWASKLGIEIIKSEAGSDPASVAYKTVRHAMDNKFDLAIIDTAGRLHNKKNLMDEYKKIITVIKKIDNNFPQETILILDATTGQNALNQIEEFSKVQKITGIIITKLDSSAKGGVVLAISKKYKLPILALGLGEKEDDLVPFKSDEFTKGLLDLT